MTMYMYTTAYTRYIQTYTNVYIYMYKYQCGYQILPAPPHYCQLDITWIQYKEKINDDIIFFLILTSHQG